uniref:Uncharacterized protein n=1 Tax=Enterobacter cloacae TaxID=550 RepID=A0A0G3AZ83_ENTCL|nr:hypothetical protein [Enterobacter cloacae]
MLYQPPQQGKTHLHTVIEGYAFKCSYVNNVIREFVETYMSGLLRDIIDLNCTFNT